MCINNLEKEEAEVGVRTTQGMNSHNSCVPWADILEISLITSWAADAATENPHTYIQS